MALRETRYSQSCAVKLWMIRYPCSPVAASRLRPGLGGAGGTCAGWSCRILRPRFATFVCMCEQEANAALKALRIIPARSRGHHNPAESKARRPHHGATGSHWQRAATCGCRSAGSRPARGVMEMIVINLLVVKLFVGKFFVTSRGVSIFLKSGECNENVR